MRGAEIPLCRGHEMDAGLCYLFFMVLSLVLGGN